MRGVTQITQKNIASGKSFQLTRLMRGVTRIYTSLKLPQAFQLTRLMRGVTRQTSTTSRRTITFQLTRLMRGVTVVFAVNRIPDRFQLTRLMRGVTLKYPGDPNGAPAISTHTPHARRDRYRAFQVLIHQHFNSHASCEA